MKAAWWQTVALVCVIAGQGTRGTSLQQVDTRQERVKAAVARVYDTSRLHRIGIVIAPEGARTILNRIQAAWPGTGATQ